MKPNPFLDVIVRSCLNVPRNLVEASPARSRLSIPKFNNTPRLPFSSEWPREHFANEPFGFLNVASRTMAVLALVLCVVSAGAAVREVGPIELTVNDLNRELHFFTNTLLFQPVAIAQWDKGSADHLLGLSGTKLRSAELRLGSERIRLTEHLGKKGRPIPADSRSYDHWFQHIAIVVSDMDRAYERLRTHSVKHVSTGPQTLPAWNKDAGGIKAFYFRDPEDHVLEIIWFPPGKGDPRWQQRAASVPLAYGIESSQQDAGGRLFLGIDHTAIVVSDTARSLAFYTNVLGLRVVGGAENHGVEQEHLNQVFGARLRITALRAERGPGIEFLEYITPPGGRPLPGDTKANDLVFWRTHLVADGTDWLSDGKSGMHVRPVSLSGASGSFIIRDPDGHALQLDDLRRSQRSADRLSAPATARPTGSRQAQGTRSPGGLPIRDTAE
jgi:catechol 2,3-dioxygenase-like lactoylglutathione lyase family enzyme